MAKPKIKVPLDPTDKFIEMVGLVAILILIGLPFFYFDKLPESIPQHFGLNGKPDHFGDKGLLWGMPMIGASLYAMLSVFNKYPHIFSYPKKITEENAFSLYRIATKMLRLLNTSVACFFAYSTYTVIQTALGNQKEIGSYSILFFMTLIFGPIIYYMYKLIRGK